jgi:FMN-dependent NADH-azoreductase
MSTSSTSATPSQQPTLLRIDASARHEDSASRRVADAVQTRWLAAHPHGRVIRRDLASEAIGHIQQDTITGYYTPADQLTPSLVRATEQSDRLIAELMSAHTVLIATPMYNFSMPSSLKAWIDQIVRIGRTFAYQDGAFQGLVTQPRAVLALAYGAGGYTGPFKAMDFLRPYLVSLLGFLGITRVDVVAVEATTTPNAPAELKRALAEAGRLFAEPLHERSDSAAEVALA